MRSTFYALNFRLLCLSLFAGDPGKQAEAAALLSEYEPDWTSLCLSAEIHAVRPQLYKLLSSVSHVVPLEILSSLSEAVRENQFRQLDQLSEFFTVHAMLQAAAIRIIPFKGFALAARFYSDLSERECADVDLFIDAKHLSRTRQLMFARGYTAEAPLPDLTEEYILRELCEYNFDKYDGDERRFHFEMHWRPGMTSLGMDVKLADLEGHIVQQQIQNRGVETFSPAAELLLIIMHHGGKDQFLQLKQLLDISKIIKYADDINWQWLLAQAEKFHVQKLLFVGIKMASILTAAEIPSQVSAEANSRLVAQLAKNRIKRLQRRQSFTAAGNIFSTDLIFRLQTRTNKALRVRIVAEELRRNIFKALVPAKFRHHFFNKKIRQSVN